MFRNTREQVAGKPDYSSSAALPVQNSLGLKVSENGSALELEWNRLSPIIQGADAARLTITDGALLRLIDLDQDQLRSGRIVYIPVVGDVLFRLEVRTRTSPPVVESLRVFNGVLSRISDPPPLAGNSLGPDSDRSRSTSAYRKRSSLRAKEIVSSTPTVNVTGTHAPISQAVGVVPLADAAQSSRKNQQRPSPAQASPAEQARQVPENAAKSNQASPNVVLAQLHSPTAPVAQPPAPVSQTNAATEAAKAGDHPPQATTLFPEPVYEIGGAPNAQPAVTTPKLGDPTLPRAPLTPQPEVRSNLLPGTASAYVPPRVLKQVQPELRFVRPLLYKSWEIEVHVNIDASGRVTDVKVPQNRTKPSQMLVSAAISAAKGWVFEPATLRGKRIPANYAIVFRFEPEK